MKKPKNTYYVSVIEMVRHTVKVEADDYVEADRKAHDLIDSGKFDWSNGSYSGYEIEEVEGVK